MKTNQFYTLNTTKLYEHHHQTAVSRDVSALSRARDSFTQKSTLMQLRSTINQLSLTTLRSCIKNSCAIFQDNYQRLKDISTSDGLCDDDFASLNPSTFILKPMKANEFERDQINNVHYMTHEQRQNYRLSPYNGVLYKGDGIVPLDTTKLCDNETFSYVIAKDGEIYAAKARKRTIHHSSFLAADDVLAAGEMSIRNGKVIYLDNNSGHYRPKVQHLLQAVWILHKQGVLSAEAKVSLRHDGAYSLKDGVARLIELNFPL